MIKKLEDFYKNIENIIQMIPFTNPSLIKLDKSQDVKFILLWLSFNIAYANKFTEMLEDKTHS